MKFWHWVVVIVVVFVCLDVWQAGTLAKVPLVGGFLSQS